MRMLHHAVAIVVWLIASITRADDPAAVSDTSRGDALVAEYFRLETERIERESFAEIKTLEDWTSRRDEYRRQLHEMLGLDPLPEKTPLRPIVTGTVDHPEFTVEKLHFQSLPDLHVTANLYVPKGLTGKAPTILYVCGHAKMLNGDRSLGNKTGYQHHGAWFARHGYVCLTIDSLQLGEVEGIHHGTHRYGEWWWNSRGYTPAGVEAWNCIRALDYLENRPEVDTAKIGVTGRSGGGAYSWWIAALDDRIACAVPVAGITTLRNHVVDGCVEGHCDCMFMVNTYGWDYAQVAALVAPRPLLISNTDKDKIFPLDGVVKVHEQVRRIYRFYGAEDQLGLQITEGPHKDTQELHIHAFVWMNRFLKGENPPIDVPADKLFEPTQLRVFGDLPSPERNSSIDKTFVAAAAEPPVPQNAAKWAAMRDTWLQELREKSFRAWPADSPNDALTLEVSRRATGELYRGKVQCSLYEFTSQAPYRLPLIVMRPTDDVDQPIQRIEVRVYDQGNWNAIAYSFREAFPDAGFPEMGGFSGGAIGAGLPEPGTVAVYVTPRGVGLTKWASEDADRPHVLRRFMLLGQTIHSARVYDVRRAIQAVRQILGTDVPIKVWATDDAAVWALYASLYEPGISELELLMPPTSHRDGPDFLNVLRILDLPQAMALAAERAPVRAIMHEQLNAWSWCSELQRNLDWDADRFRVIDLKSLP